MRSAPMKETVKRPILELVEELKAKIALLEGDRRAYYESSYITMQQHRDKISSLRRELHELRKCLWDKTHADITVVSQAFQNRPVEKSAFSSKSAKVAIEEMDYRVSDAMKRYNQVKYVTMSKKKHYQTLVAELRNYEMSEKTADDDSFPAYSMTAMQRIRDMENRYDKLMLKYNECEFIQQTYKQIYDRLYQEHAKCNHTLDQLESDIRRCQAEKNDLVVIHEDALNGREITLTELHRLEEFVYADKKRRDIEVFRMRKVAEEHKLENERVEKKAADDQTEKGASGGKVNDDTTEMSSTKDSTTTSSGYDSYEENYERLRSVTGIPNVQDNVTKFENQLHVKHNLITLINNMEASINTNREMRSAKQDQLLALKSRVESKSFDVQHMVDEKRLIVKRKHNDFEKMSEENNYVSTFVSAAKFGLEHMMEKLVHVKTTDSSKVPAVKPTTAEQYILDIFRRIKMKVHQLLTELGEYNINDYLEKMKTEQLILMTPHAELESGLRKQVPLYNMRLSLEKFKDVDLADEESGDDNFDWKSREMMKSLSAEVIEAKTRKAKHRRKKRGK